MGKERVTKPLIRLSLVGVEYEASHFVILSVLSSDVIKSSQCICPYLAELFCVFGLFAIYLKRC